MDLITRSGKSELTTLHDTITMPLIHMYVNLVFLNKIEQGGYLQSFIAYALHLNS